MNRLNKTFQSKHLFIIGIASCLISFSIGGIIGASLEKIGLFIIIMAVIALFRELKKLKKIKNASTKK